MTKALLSVETNGVAAWPTPGTPRSRSAPPADRLSRADARTARTARSARARPTSQDAPPPHRRAERPSTWRRASTRSRPRSAPYAYVAPFFLVFAAFGLFPLIYTAWISLHDYQLGSDDDLDRPRQLRAGCSPTRRSTTPCWKTFTIGVLSTVPQLLLALGLAHLLNYRMRGRTFFRVAMLMPYATSVAAATLVFAQLFGRDAGFDQLAARGRRRRPRSTGATATGRRRSPSPSIVIWRWTGYNALIYLAGMQSIPPGPLRGRRDRRRQPLAAVPARDAAGAAAHDPVHRRGLHDRRDPAVRRAAAVRRRRGRRAAPWTSTRPSACSCTSRAGSIGQLGRAAAVAWVMFLMIVVLVLVNTALVRWRTRSVRR